MRILHWIDSFYPHVGGAEVFVDRLMTLQHAQGETVMLVTGMLDGPLPTVDEWRGVPLRRLPLLSPLHTGDLAALRASVAEVKATVTNFAPDVLHVQFCNVTLLAYVMAAVRPAPQLVLTLQTAPDQITAPRALIGRLIQAADHLVPVSVAMDQAWADAFPEVTTPRTVIYNALPEPPLTPDPPPAAPLLLAFGRLQPVKGFDVALRALRRLHDAGLAYPLVIAGEGPARAELEALTARLDLTHAVTFTGLLGPDTIPALINRVSLVLVPSRWQEPFGLVALQGGQMARPVVASAVGGLPEIVVDGETGRLVPPDDPVALADAVATLLADRVAAQRMGAQARRHVLDRFGMARCAAAYRALYAQSCP